MMGGYFMAWDLATGNLAWKGEAMDYPWSEPASELTQYNQPMECYIVKHTMVSTLLTGMTEA